MEYYIIGYFVFVLIACIIVSIVMPKNKTNKQIQYPRRIIYSNANKTTYIKPENNLFDYQAKYLLTKNEWYEFKKLQEIAKHNNLLICPKVRLADIIEPRHNTKNYKSLFYKIQAKHIDFLICDYTLKILAILELDDNSHNRADRRERDQFVDKILTGVGYTVIRTRSITEETLSPILNKPFFTQEMQ